MICDSFRRYCRYDTLLTELKRNFTRPRRSYLSSASGRFVLEVLTLDALDPLLQAQGGGGKLMLAAFASALFNFAKPLLHLQHSWKYRADHVDEMM